MQYMKQLKKLELLKDKGIKEYFLFVNERYAIYLGGMSAIYDTTKNKDIPQWVLKLKEILSTINI